MKKPPKLTAIDSACRPEKGSEADREMHEFYQNIEIDTLARTLWGEARGEGERGMHAVANVIINRARHAEKRGKFWWGNNIIQVCQKPYQFSCWNRSDPNFRKLQTIDTRNFAYATALKIAKRAVLETFEDMTNGATHYHAKSIEPYWAKNEIPLISIGNHVFYRLVK